MGNSKPKEISTFNAKYLRTIAQNKNDERNLAAAKEVDFIFPIIMQLMILAAKEGKTIASFYSADKRIEIRKCFNDKIRTILSSKLTELGFRVEFSDDDTLFDPTTVHTFMTISWR